MVKAAAHLVDHVFPQLSVRQWVLSVPKRLWYFMQKDSAVLNAVLRIFLRVVQSHLHQHWRLLRYCARPPFALERLHQRGQNVVYHCPKPQPGGKQQDLILTPLELIDRIAALVPPPRSHRHRYFGVCDAPSDDAVVEPNWIDVDQSTPDIDIDQSTRW